MSGTSTYHRAILFVILALSLLVVGVSAAFASDGTFLFKWGTSGVGDGQFNRPHDVAIGPGGDVYVMDSLNNRVQRFASNGAFVSQFGIGGGGQTYGIHVDTSGNVFVADSSADAVRKYSSSGSLLLTIPSIGDARDIATDAAGNIYVVSTSTNSVRRYDSAGGAGVSLITGLSGPRCIAIDSAGFLYVTEFAANRVSRFTSGGAPAGQWGSFGSGDGQFIGDVGIAIGPDGSVYTTEIGNASNPQNNRVQKFTPAGVFVTKWGAPGSGDGQFAGARGIAINAAGDAYVADTDNHRIQVFGTTSPPVVSTGASAPWSLAMGALIAGALTAIAARRRRAAA